MNTRRRSRSVGAVFFGQLLIIGLALPGTLPAQPPSKAPDSWIGERVVPRAAKLPLRMNDEPVESEDNAPRFYKVEQVDGALLFLRPLGRGASGWAGADQVIGAREALDYYSRKVLTDSKDPFSFAMLGLLSADRDEYDLAIRSYSFAIRLDPRHAASYTGRASSWYALKKYDKAIADYDRAIVLDSKNSDPYVGRGLVHTAREQYTQAVADLSEAIWLDPLSTSAYVSRGRAWGAKHEYAKAIVDYNMALRLDPGQAVVYRERGNAWEGRKSFRKALADYSESIRIDPRDARTCCDRATLLSLCPERELRDAKLAIASATKACELTGWKEVGALEVLSVASAAAGDFESAVRWQTKANALARSSLEQKEGEARLKRYAEKRLEP